MIKIGFVVYFEDTNVNKNIIKLNNTTNKDIKKPKFFESKG